MEEKDWAALRDEAKNLEALADEMFKQGDAKLAKKTYHEAADRALLALYAVPAEDKRARKELGKLIQALCEKTEQPSPKQKTAA